MPEKPIMETERLLILPLSESSYENVTNLYECPEANGPATGIFMGALENEVEMSALIKDKIRTGFNLVAKSRDKDEFIGYLRYGFLNESNAAWIYTFIISTEHRRMGYGKEFINALENQLKLCYNVPFVGLSVLSRNMQGNCFWNSVGYTLRETLVKSVVEGEGLSKINIYVKLF